MKQLLLLSSVLISVSLLATNTFAHNSERHERHHSDAKRYCHDWHYGEYHWNKKRSNRYISRDNGWRFTDSFRHYRHQPRFNRSYFDRGRRPYKRCHKRRNRHH